MISHSRGKSKYINKLIFYQMDKICTKKKQAVWGRQMLSFTFFFLLGDLVARDTKFHIVCFLQLYSYIYSYRYSNIYSNILLFIPVHRLLAHARITINSYAYSIQNSYCTCNYSTCTVLVPVNAA